MDAHKLDVKIQGHSYMHMITVKGHLGNVSLHQMINPYEWFVELIFFWSLGGQQIESFVQNLALWLIVSNSNAFVYFIVDHSVWKVLIKNAIDLEHQLYICRVSRIYCQFLRDFFMGGVGRFKSKYWNHGSFDVSLCIQCSKDWQSGDIPYIV